MKLTYFIGSLSIDLHKNVITKYSPLSPLFPVISVCGCCAMWSAENYWRESGQFELDLKVDKEEISISLLSFWAESLRLLDGTTRY